MCPPYLATPRNNKRKINMTIFIKYKNQTLELSDLGDKDKELFDQANPEYIDKINEDLIIKPSFCDDSKKVEDKWRYNLVFFNKKWQLSTPNNHLDPTFECALFHEEDIKQRSGSKNIKNIIFILESPHKDEYDKSFNPLSPARGSTGRNFHNYFASHAIPLLISLGLKLSEGTTYRIYFVNPVPFQCSLAQILNIEKINQKIRDEVWTKIYPHCKENFLSRLRLYNPYTIINGCTSGVKSDVRDSIITLPGLKLETSHPSFWKQSLAPFQLKQ